MKIFNPYSKIEIGEITLSSESQAEEIINKAQKAKIEMRNLSSGQRANILHEIIQGIQENFEEFVRIICEESGKPYRYAKGEVNRAIQTFTIASEETKRIPHEIMDLDSTDRGRGLKGEYVYFPRGIVLGISPFNFPLNLAVHKIAPAIATGCPMILKPSSKTPLTMELLSRIIEKTQLPQHGFQLIYCSREVGNKLVEHEAIDVLSFTGSPSVGWEMKAKSGKKHCVLELGGNAAAIVDKDSSLEEVVEELIVGGFAYSGQVCIHTQRIYVHESIRNEFEQKFIEKVGQIVIGNPLAEITEFGVMIDEDNAIRVENWVNEALENGARCLIGGKREGSLYEPTVLTNVKKGLKVRDEEVFGPVVILESFKTIEEVIKEVNDCRWGLQASIFTDSIQVRDQVFQELQVGGVIHNKATTFRVDDMPYGGIKDSGFGREGVRYTMMDFLEGKLLVR